MNAALAANIFGHNVTHKRDGIGCPVCAINKASRDAKRAKRLAGKNLPARIIELLLGASPDEVTACGHDAATLRSIAQVWTTNVHQPSATINGRRYARLGRGISRAAIDLGCGKHVAKVSYTRDTTQARAEVRFFEAATPAQRLDLASVVAYTADHIIVVAEKISAVCPVDPMRELKKRASAMGIGDLHGGNVGWRGDRPVVMDYGWR